MFVITFAGVTSTTATTTTTTSGFGPSSNTTSWFGHTLLRHFVARQHRGRVFIKHEFVCEVQGHQRCSSRRCASTHLGILARRAHELGTQQGLYCSAGMREVAASLSRPLPPLGCSTAALLDWQLLQSKQLYFFKHQNSV